MMRKASFGKAILRGIVTLLVIVLVIAAAYFAYLMIAYHRIGSGPVPVEGAAPERAPEEDGTYTILSYNVGFGAYEPDYGFFMDGGTESRAWSASRLNANLANIASFLEKRNDDVVLIQEVDIGSTRTYQIDERVYFTAALKNDACVFAQNYDSPYLFYPLTKPHGASKSGLMTFSSFAVTSAERVELPVESGLMKFLDLDRCYSKSRIPMDDGRELVIYNMHLSAYTSDGTIATTQLRLLVEDMTAEYQKGNYALAGGDFNKDLLGGSDAYFGASDKEYTWAQPIPEGFFDDTSVSLVAPLDEAKPVPSCRNADGPYHSGQYVLTVDGFLVTDNIEVVSAAVVDTGFAYSDHNPVEVVVRLAGAK